MRIISVSILCLLTLLSACTVKQAETSSWVQVKGHQFYVNDKPLYFVGANYWHGAILASTGRGGNRERLIKELDLMKACGITNLRVLAGAEGPDNQPFRVTPALQTSPVLMLQSLNEILFFSVFPTSRSRRHIHYFQKSFWNFYSIAITSCFIKD